MTRNLLFAASIFALAQTGCDGIWDAYLGARDVVPNSGSDAGGESGMDGGSVADMTGTSGGCTQATDCTQTQWCNRTTSACEELPVLRSVYLSDAQTVWVVGDGGLTLRLSQATSTAQTSWTPFPRIVSTQLNSVHGLSGTDVWAVGASSTILRYEGTNWRQIDAPPSVSGQELKGIVNVNVGGTIHRRAVGLAGTRIGIDGSGSSWTVDNSVVSASHLYSTTVAVVGVAYRSWAVGQTGAAQSQSQSAAWVSEPQLPQARDMYGVTWAGMDLLAVGKGGLVLLKGSGSTWSQLPSGTTQNLGGISGTSLNDVWAAGDVNTIIHYNGTLFSANSCMVAPTDFWGIYAFAANNVWAVGSNGVVCYWNGTQWFSRGLRQ